MVLASSSKPHETPQSKKRRGQHHKASKHYAKTYWPYLPMLLIVGLGFVLNSVWGVRGGVLGYATAVSTSSLLQETNIQRSNNGKTALALNGQLNTAAQEKANDMATRDYWSHTTPEGREPWQFISAAGYTYTYAGENLAYGFSSSADAVAGWMNSPSHRDNLLNTNYTDVGFGFANATNYQGDGQQTIIVAMYAAPQKVAAAAQPVPQTPAPQPAPKPAPTPQPQPATQPADSQSNDTPVSSAPAATTPPSEPPTTTASTDNGQSNGTPLRSQEVSRFDVLAPGNAEWAALVISVLVTLAGITMVYRHGKMWKRYLIKGERFIIHHPALDIAIVALLVAGAILTQTTGFIH